MSAWQRRLGVGADAPLEVGLDFKLDTISGEIGGCPAEASGVRRLDERRVILRVDGRWRRAFVFRKADVAYVALGGDVYELREIDDASGAVLADHEEAFATSPMTGVVVKLSVEAGQAVEEGAELVVVEAMKMEYVVRAPRDVVIDTVSAEAGESVEFGQVLITFEDTA